MRRCGQRLGVNASGRGRICWICWRRATRTEAKRNGIRVFEDKAACCGCGLCEAACPHQAITMTPDEEGFCYPVIDAQRCTNCGACRRVCAYGQGPKEKPLAYYAARHQDADELARSSSGGVFSAIASFVLEQGGVVFGAVFNENWFVIHTHAETVGRTAAHAWKQIYSKQYRSGLSAG
ncbi:MAG: 4Fe-4S binding protein [Christensenellales bacterium]